MVLVPVAIVATMPVEAPTVATLVILLVQVPPAGTDDSADVLPKQTDEVPDMADGITLTVTTAVLKQPVAASV